MTEIGTDLAAKPEAMPTAWTGCTATSGISTI